MRWQRKGKAWLSCREVVGGGVEGGRLPSSTACAGTVSTRKVSTGAGAATSAGRRLVQLRASCTSRQRCACSSTEPP